MSNEDEDVDVDVTMPTTAEWDAVVDEVRRYAKSEGDAVLGDPDATTEELRASIMRTRLAAAAERQSTASRAVVVDWMVASNDHSEGPPRWRFVVATPTGDMVEQREAAIMMWAAWLWTFRRDHPGVTLAPPDGGAP